MTDRPGRRVLRDALVSLSVLAASTAPVAWWLPGFIRSGGADHAGTGVVWGSVWLASLMFTGGVMWEAGGYWAGRHHRPAVRSAQVERRVRPRPVEYPVARPEVGGFVPMSQRPDPATRVDLPPVVTRIQPRVEVWQNWLDTTENCPVVSDSSRQDQLF